ncbi:hypothetical protein [Streptomyces sp. NPDC091209]|uniref:hypothetical protein n=1 Tax=Streptomyces sp. NPDC091209 TaxID=3365974 RepID=UPI003830597C
MTTPPGADPRWVRADGAFIDAVDPAAPARELRSVTRARRDGCTFTGTLAPGAAPEASVEPAVARARVASAEPVAATSTPTAGAPSVNFTARIDDRGRLIRLTTEASPDRLPVAARYWDFGLAVTASAPPSGGASTSSSETPTLTGKWTGNWSTSLGSGGFTATLSQDGKRITGALKVDGVPCSLDGSVTGTLEGGHITFGSVNSARTISFTGDVDGDTMHGSFETNCYETSGSWTAQRSGS